MAQVTKSYKIDTPKQTVPNSILSSSPCPLLFEYIYISKYHTSDSEHPSPSSRSCGSLESLLRGQPHAPLPCHQWIQWIRKQIRNDYSILLRPLHTPIPPLSASSSKQRHKQRAQAIALPNVHPVSEGNFE